jgi:AraC family transcriptional regulator of adaptative response / DNA-3-methyladenine glycosylase II
MRAQSTERPGHLTDSIEINLPLKPPYDWQAILQFYQSHFIPGVERVTGDSFARVFRVKDKLGFVEVRPLAAKSQLKISIVSEDPKTTLETARRIRKMFDLDCDPGLIAKSFKRIPLLATLCRRFPGLRVARGWDCFETAICTILGQLVSAGHREHLIGQLVSNYGEEVVDPSTSKRAYLFPGAGVLASSDLSAISTTTARREAIREFSRRVLSRDISLTEGQDPVAFRKALLETKGLGPWSVEYIRLRTGDTDAFPKTDLILKRVLDLHPDLDLERIKPWRSYAAVYLWKEFAQTLSRSRNRKHS